MFWLLFALSPAQAEDPPGLSVEVQDARHFTLGKAHTHEYLASKPSFDEGWIVRIRAEPDQLAQRGVASPVLYAGAMPVMRFNRDFSDGCAVVVVPGDANWKQQPWFFGPAQLPERITEGAAAKHLETAKQGGAQPLDPSSLDRLPESQTLEGRTINDVYRVALAMAQDCPGTQGTE